MVTSEAQNTVPRFSIWVGSTNPTKRQAVVQAVTDWQAEVNAIEVSSGVSAQPMTDDETKKGADNRALGAWEAGVKVVPKTDSQTQILGIGLEGGVFQPEAGSLWSTVWVSVTADGKNCYRANGARFALPKEIAEPILAGAEMGVVVGEMAQNPNLKKEGGMIGLITQNMVSRTGEYAHIARLALGLWWGREWRQAVQNKLQKI